MGKIFHILIQNIGGNVKLVGRISWVLYPYASQCSPRNGINSTDSIDIDI